MKMPFWLWELRNRARRYTRHHFRADLYLLRDRVRYWTGF